jgi:uncharacterized protein (DUF952 family)
MRHVDLIYKIASREVATASRQQGSFTGMAVDLADGFVHFSTADQLPETLRRHFRNQQDLVLLAVRTASLGPALRWEPSRGGALFPHLYGPLPMSAVVREASIAVDSRGRCALPGWVQ